MQRITISETFDDNSRDKCIFSMRNSGLDDISTNKGKACIICWTCAEAGSIGRQGYGGYISKHGPSMLRFIMINTAHTVIKYSRRMKNKNLSLVRRIGKNMAIVAIARILLEKIFIMLTRGEKFIDNVDELTERKIRSMEERNMDIQRIIKLIKGNWNT